MLKQLHGAKVFTKLDLHNAYNLIQICNGDEWNTTFVTPTGHWEYLVMPYGLVNAPFVFQDFMHNIFRHLLNRFVIVYIDDNFIYSNVALLPMFSMLRSVGKTASTDPIRKC